MRPDERDAPVYRVPLADQPATMGVATYDLPPTGLGAPRDDKFAALLRPAAPQVWLHGRRGPAIFPPGRPVFFTTDLVAAANDARFCPLQGQPRVHAALLDIRRPAGYYDLLRAIRRTHTIPAAITHHAEAAEARDVDAFLVARVRAALARAGYDGYLGWTLFAGREIPVAVAFRPEQIILLDPAAPDAGCRPSARDAA
ncbi:MAG TPA: hypothetical protein VFL91_32495 [Thermomicrobiales bacterium]|nr:hypothetical protein [Thermomicrobiales bacterium]